MYFFYENNIISHKDVLKASVTLLKKQPELIASHNFHLPTALKPIYQIDSHKVFISQLHTCLLPSSDCSEIIPKYKVDHGSPTFKTLVASHHK